MLTNTVIWEMWFCAYCNINAANFLNCSWQENISFYIHILKRSPSQAVTVTHSIELIIVN